MKKDNIRKQINAIKKETDNPAIINDVTDTEFGVIPSGVEAGRSGALGEVEESIVKNTVDGKTWNETD